MISPLYSALFRLHLDYCVPFGTPQHKTDVDKLEQAQQKAFIMVRDWSTFPVKRDKVSWVCSAWRRDISGVRGRNLLPKIHQEDNQAVQGGYAVSLHSWMFSRPDWVQPWATWSDFRALSKRLDERFPDILSNLNEPMRLLLSCNIE